MMMQKPKSPTDAADNSVVTVGTTTRQSPMSASASNSSRQGAGRVARQSNAPATNARATSKDGDMAASNSQNARIADLLDSEYRGISLYTVTMILLVIAILWTGISVVEQIQTYHKSYNQLAKLKREFRQLQIEHQRMMIEQQTFSGTPQVTSRAATQLNMFYPDFSDRMIIHANGVVAKPPGHADKQRTSNDPLPDATLDTPSNTPNDNTPSNTEPSQPAPETQH